MLQADSGAQAQRAGEAVSGGESENLALLYQGLLTGIVRLQAGRQQVPDVESFRRRTKANLQEIERAAAASGYDANDLRVTHFAVIAFLDSVMLRMNDAIRHEWERKTLQQELFGQTDAGVVFFEKLDQLRSRRDSAQLADMLEVYLLCLLLGFEGRYSGMRGELDAVVERTRSRIELLRGPRGPISPSAQLPAETAVAAPQSRQAPLRLYAAVAAGSVILMLLLFILFKLNLISYAEQIRGKVS